MMKLLWVVGCLLAALDMLLIAFGVKPSSIVSPDFQWLAIFPFVGWVGAACSAARVNRGWLE